MFIGYQAGQLDAASNKLVISNGPGQTLIYGDFKKGHLGIGKFPQSRLDIANGDVRLASDSEFMIGNFSGPNNTFPCTK